MSATITTALPSEILLSIFSSLSVEDLQSISLTCRKLKKIALSDLLWRPLVQSYLAKSPPARSINVCPMTDPPPPWDPSFGLVSIDRNPAAREPWFAAPPGAETECNQDSNTPMSCWRELPLTLFPGACSYHEVYWTFVHPLHKLLGWWLGDLPSYGIILRIVFDPLHRSEQQSEGGREMVGGVNPAFLCEKVHLVNRLNGMGSKALRSPWNEATSFDIRNLHGLPDADGTTIETERLSIDVSIPGIKTEVLWQASWTDCIALRPKARRLGTDMGRITWSGSHIDPQSARYGCAQDPTIMGSQGQSSFVSRARALAEQMVFGRSSRQGGTANSVTQGRVLAEHEMDMFDEEEDELPDVGPGVFGHGLNISQIVAASAVDTFENGDFDHIPHQLRTIQQRSGSQMHTVFLSSGAILTSPVEEKGTDKEPRSDRLSLRSEKYCPYDGADVNTHRAFQMRLSDYMPLPPIDFPPPALLPLVRDLDEKFESPTQSPTTNSSFAYERFLDQGTSFEINTLRMEPCPPYRPWPHLSQPQPSGLRFIPIQSPPLENGKPPAVRKGLGDKAWYEHPLRIPARIDPGSLEFDWDSLQGLYGMTYGPWGLELIYIRSRILTRHDFDPSGVTLDEKEELSRPTGPHGPGHAHGADRRSLRETLHWRPEPYIDVRDLQLSREETSFIRPGCRVIEGVKCSGDANVPRGTISFRAFSRGQTQDTCIAYFPPDPQHAHFPPWNGDGIHLGREDPYQRRQGGRSHTASPGRILDCATGRLAMEGFVNAGCWKRCSVKITSADEVQVYWEALRKVAVAKRLTAC